ncbi:MAG: DUF4421 family protein [Chitinophagaceae bacterium]
MLKWVVLFLIIQNVWLSLLGQVKVDSTYIADFDLPYVARVSLERTGAGLEISPDHTLVPPTASFPFNTGTNLALYLSYKFINLSISPSLNRKTNNRSLVISLNTYNGASNVGGKIGFYNNVASIQDKKTLNVRTAINLFKLSPYWLLNTNYKKFSLAAITDYSQRQRRSAGAFMFEFNPNLLRAKGRNRYIIPSDASYEPRFEDMTGLYNVTIVNLDFRPGYVYTKVFEEGSYFVSGGLFLGPGFGYHHARAAASTVSGMHWQSSVRMFGSAGYSGDRYFVSGSFRYTNSFTPISSVGILADEGSFMLTLGLRFDAFEDTLPDTWNDLIRKRK